MTWVALAAVVLALWLLYGGKRGAWRPSLGLVSVGMLVAAALLGLRGLWWASAVLAILAFNLAFLVRRSRSGKRTGTGAGEPTEMSLADARSLLGVGPQATPEEIEAAYRRLMRTAHPDTGGTTGLAAQLNAARDRLLKERQP